MPTIAPVKDDQTVSSQGIAVAKRIAGVVVDRRTLHEDERGELVEIYNPAWGIHASPMVYAYFVSIRPGKVKGWVLHNRQDDRIFFFRGVVRVALYDSREDSATYKMLNVLVMSERSRGLLIIPRGVYHALKNIGTEDALFMNLPTRAYDHADPDKYRLSVTNDLIPFSFDDGPGR
jgi:dTDP-4-dehydrorhamnose 3,5-epimerase